jgi:hypothetical protein
MKYVPGTIAIGPNGRYVTRGYTDLGGGLRVYDDQITIGSYGERVVSPGWIEWPQERLGVDSQSTLYRPSLPDDF